MYWNELKRTWTNKVTIIKVESKFVNIFQIIKLSTCLTSCDVQNMHDWKEK